MVRTSQTSKKAMEAPQEPTEMVEAPQASPQEHASEQKEDMSHAQPESSDEKRPIDQQEIWTFISQEVRNAVKAALTQAAVPDISSLVKEEVRNAVIEALAPVKAEAETPFLTPPTGAKRPSHFDISDAGQQTEIERDLTILNIQSTANDIDHSNRSDHGVQISKAISAAASLPSLSRGPYRGHADNRSASYFQNEVETVTRGLNAAAVFFYTKRSIDTDLFERIPFTMGTNPTERDFGIAIKELFGWLRSTFDTISTKERILSEWAECKQEDHETVHEFVYRLSGLLKERRLMALEPPEFERSSKLRRAIRDPMINFWLSLQPEGKPYDQLEADLLKFTAGQPPMRAVAPLVNAISSIHDKAKGHQSNKQQKAVYKEFNTGCARCRDRTVRLHEPNTCTVARPSWWASETCAVCGRLHRAGDACPSDGVFSKQKCKRCGENGHSIVVCGMDKEVVNLSSSPQSSLTTLELVTANGYKFKAVVDTGASLSCMSLEYFNQLAESDASIKLQRISHPGIVVANGQTVPAEGRTKFIAVLSNGSHLVIEALVVKSLSQGFLLSDKALRSNGDCVWIMSANGSDKMLLGQEATQIAGSLTQYQIGNAIIPERHAIRFQSCNCIQIYNGPHEMVANVAQESNGPQQDIKAKGFNHDDLPMPFLKEATHFTSLIPWLSSRRPKGNHDIVMERTAKQLRKLNEEQLSHVTTVLNELLRLGVIEECERHEIAYFLPLRLVHKPSDTTPLRITIDAREFNRFVRQGHSACQHMRRTFLLWRTFRYFISTDLRKAFYSIRISTPERKWFGITDTGKYFRFARLPMGLTYSPKVLEEILDEIEKEIANEQSRGTQNHATSNGAPLYKSTRFVDDVQYGGDTPEQVLQNAEISLKQLENYGFQPSADKTFSNTLSTWAPKRNGFVLGHAWDAANDAITQEFKTRIDDMDLNPVRSEVVSILTSAWYDPYGLQLEFTSTIRAMISKVIANSTDWDQPVAPEVMQEVKQFVQANANRVFQIKRFIDLDKVFVFADASGTNWAIDIRDKNLNRIFARVGRTSPGSTIPRSELDALKRAVATVEELLDDLPMRNILYLTDSQITIMRLRRSTMNKTLKQFETKRLEFIRDRIKRQKSCVAHVPTTLNLADAATRPGSVSTDSSEIRALIASHIETAERVEKTTYKTMEERALATSTDDEASDEETYDGDLEREGSQQLESINITTRTHEYISPVTRPEELQLDSLIAKIKASQQMHPIQWDGRIMIVENGLTYRMCGVEVTENAGDRYALSLKQLIVPWEDRDLQEEIIRTVHEACGHTNGQRTLAVIKRHFYWKGMRQNCERYCQKCMPCIITKTKRKFHHYCGVSPWSEKLWTIVGVDHAHLPVVESDGKKYTGYISITDYVSKFTVTSATTTRTTQEVIQYMEHVFGILGYPQTIVHDGASVFANKAFHDYARKRMMSLFQIAPYAAESAGWFERPHKTLKTMLRAKLQSNTTFEGANPVDCWPDLLASVTIAQNLIPYDTKRDLDLCPATLNLGYYPRSFDAAKMDTSLVKPLVLSDSDANVSREIEDNRRRNLNTYVEFWSRKREEIREVLMRRGRRMHLHEGQKVMIYRPRATALDPEWQGFGTIERLDGSLTEIRLPDDRIITEHRVNLLPIHGPVFPGARESRAPV